MSSGGTKKQRINKGTYEDVNIVRNKWLQIQRLENVPTNAQILLDFAKPLGIEKFQASDGWHYAWKVRYSISFREVSGESNSLTQAVTRYWEETSLPPKLSRFQLKDIYNAEEFGLFYQGLLDQT